MKDEPEWICEFVREIRKRGRGGFDGYGRCLSEFRSHASESDIIALYCNIRDNSYRWESEWRGRFLRRFPGASRYLPPVNPIEKAPQTLARLIKRNDLNAIKEFIRSTHLCDDKPKDPVSAFKTFERLGPSAMTIVFYPFSETDFYESAAGFARDLGRLEIADYFEHVTTTQRGRFLAAAQLGKELYEAQLAQDQQSEP